MLSLQRGATAKGMSPVSRTVRRYSILTGLAICVGLAGPIAAAEASDNTIRGTIGSWGPTIVKDETAVEKGLNGYPHGKVKPLVKALNHEVSDLHKLQKKLHAEHASTSKGRKGKNDITKGLGLIATAYGALSKDVQQAHGAPVPVAQVNSAVSTDKKGRAQLKKGLGLLS
jgi:hypothetical protein